MKLNFCTLFNSAYLSRGLVMYHSLLKQCPDFHLYVFAFDDLCYEYLKKQNFAHLTVVSLQEFEDSELLRVKPSRTAAEYCWTSTASTILYSINAFGLQNCTYIDADMCFYSNPAVLIDEMGDNSVLITDHRYTPEYDQSVTSGKYCVQFVTFKNTKDGLTVLNWWRNACIEWCYNRVEDGKFGDQKYLDSWTTQFKGVHELKHLGGGVAPWNVQQYTFAKQGDKIIGTEIASGNSFEVVFFHYHSFKCFENDIVLLSDTEYYLTENVIQTFYKTYVKDLMKQYAIVKKQNDKINANGVFSAARFGPMGIKTILQYYKDNLRSSKRNVFGKKLLSQIKNHSYYSITDFIR